MRKLLATTAILLSTMACSHRAQTTLPGMFLQSGPTCQMTAHLSGCDYSVEPPKCKKINLKYDKGCGRVEAK